ncbi:MAG: S41 family peptidase [Pedobacter sp.]
MNKMTQNLMLLSLLITLTSNVSGQTVKNPVMDSLSDKIVLKSEDLDKYIGIYSGEKLSLKIVISKNNTTLMAQGTGQDAFPLEATAKDQFLYQKAGIGLLFNVDRSEMTLKQGGNTFVFTREGTVIGQMPLVYQPKAMQADLNKFKNVLIKTHPGLYTHQSPEEFNTMTDNMMSEVSKPMDATSFYKVLRKIFTSIHDDHTGVYPIGRLDSILSSQRLLPFQVYLKDERIYITKNLSNLPIADGSEILSIDGHLSNDIILEIFKYCSTDGKSHAGVQHILSRPSVFSNFYAQILGGKLFHDVSYRDYQSKKIVTVQVESVPKEAYASRRAGKYPAEKKPSEGPFNFEMNKRANYAIIKISSFVKDSFQDPENTYPDYYRNCFKEISANKITNLIIDLRDNGGGDAKNAGYLLQYFIDKPVTLAKEITSLGNNEYFLKTTGDQLELDERYGMVMQDDRTFKVTKSDILREIAPFLPIKQYPFKGKVVVLINGGMFSAAGIAAGLFKEYTNAILVGSETAGYAGISNGVQKIFVKGDQTETGITIPLLHTVYAINPVLQKRGALPDYEASNSVEDMLENRDAVLEFTFKTILQITVKKALLKGM